MHVDIFAYTSIQCLILRTWFFLNGSSCVLVFLSALQSVKMIFSFCFGNPIGDHLPGGVSLHSACLDARLHSGGKHGCAGLTRPKKANLEAFKITVGLKASELRAFFSRQKKQTFLNLPSFHESRFLQTNSSRQ